MNFATASLLLVSLLGTDAAAPDDFLNVESKAWSRWLDEDVETCWHGVELRRVLADQFGAAEILVDDEKALRAPITFDAADLSRRTTLWRLSKKHGFTVRWAQKNEPRVFLGLSEAQRRQDEISGRTITKVTYVMRSDYATYLKRKRQGDVTKEKLIDGLLYYAVDVDRDMPFEDGLTGWYTEVQRFKTTPPKEPPQE